MRLCLLSRTTRFYVCGQDKTSPSFVFQGFPRKTLEAFLCQSCSYSRRLPPQRVRRGYPGHSYAAPSTTVQERIPWTFLCGSLHNGSMNSGSLHTARSRSFRLQNLFIYAMHVREYVPNLNLYLAGISALEFMPSRTIAGYALCEKGLQRQIGDGPLVSSQERRAAVVPRVNRLSCSSTGLHRTSFARASQGSFRTVVFDALEAWRARETVVSWADRPVGVPSCPAPLRPAASPCAAPPRPACGISGPWIQHIIIFV